MSVSESHEKNVFGEKVPFVFMRGKFHESVY